MFLAFLSETLTAARVDTLNIAPFGNVFIYSSGEKATNMVIMISGDGGWKFGVTGFSERFSRKNAIVAGVDILRYYGTLKKREGECYNVVSDFVNLATAVEKKYGFAEYRPALLMGYSSGATLVFGILAQARPGTFIGGISLGFCSDMELPKMLCQINGLVEKPDGSGKRFFLQPESRLGNPWIVLHGALDKVCYYSDVVSFVRNTSNSELITLPKVGHGFSRWSDFMPQWDDAFNRLINRYDKDQQLTTEAEDLKAMPLIIINNKIEINRAPLAIMISGDGGWYWFEQSIADSLARLGISTIGLDAKKYFWDRKSPDETAHDFGDAMSYFGDKFGIDRFLVLGYSLGAEVVPFIITRLPEKLRSEIISTVLLSPGEFTDFEIHITNMIGLGNLDNTYNVANEINKLSGGNILCIFGKDEQSKVPEYLNKSIIKIKFIPGDHHYNNNLPLIIRTLREEKVI
jgi:type IV secretory pathway VirJ component